MVWLLILLLAVNSFAAEHAVEIAGREYLVTSAFGGDILNGRCRQDLLEELRDSPYYGVIITDYSMEEHLERLKDLDLHDEMGTDDLERMGERIFLTFARKLYQEGFDVAVLGQAGLDLVERGLVSFYFADDTVFYSNNLYYTLPLDFLPHLDWERTYAEEVKHLREVALENSGDPFYTLTILALDSFGPDPEKQIVDFRESLAKANREGSALDRAWQRLEEIWLQLKRQKLRNY